MGVCSYCLMWQRDECFGWDQAKACAKISGPDDPKYLTRKAELMERDASQLRREAREIEFRAGVEVGHKRRAAERLDAERAALLAKIAGAA
ncbi:hypothetical protein MKK88_33595 [Methylobacterium sp. E-005]|uniref:hypothetical protein n=1 Tax=Methylobacterium sp. E-005 TaxID=2836549 RepID=UPI001FB9E9E5|nr:hypothetical protein [Methylobacterium sp. E-005]MCJ2090881.1 hypothetical protein [Methylobacterium sp. E-005]